MSVEMGVIWDRLLCRKLSRTFRFFRFRPHIAIQMALHLLFFNQEKNRAKNPFSFSFSLSLFFSWRIFRIT